MVGYRICNRLYSNDITGEGARRYGARWNPIDTAMLYASTHISLAALEILVHGAFKKSEIEYDLLTLKIPEILEPLVFDEDILGSAWRQDQDLTQQVGRSLIEYNNFIALVPSAVVPEEQNILINPAHKLFGRVEIIGKRASDFEQRLF
jgi:RES domain-containing protein